MNDFEFKRRMKAHSEKMKSSIASPFDITKKIDETENCTMTKHITSLTVVRNIIYSAAGAAAAFVLTFNCIPNLAYAVNDIPILNDVVRVVTFGRFEIDEDTYSANVVTPKIEGLLDKELEEKLNNEFRENAAAVISAFESDVKELKENYGDNGFHMGVDSSYIVRTDNDNILAIDCYIVNMAGSSSTTHKFYTINKKTGELLTLKSLFKDGADYQTPISQYIIGEMKKQNESDTGYFWIGDEPDSFERIKPNQNFFINGDGNLVICFDKYEVAAGAGGCPEFEIPHNVIEDILK